MGPKTTALCERLREILALLQSVGEHHWAAWIDKSLARIENGDLSGVDYLLRAYGGMGSFNDLILSSANGHKVRDADYQDVNIRLDRLRTELFALARDVRRRAIFEN